MRRTQDIVVKSVSSSNANDPPWGASDGRNATEGVTLLKGRRRINEDGGDRRKVDGDEKVREKQVCPSDVIFPPAFIFYRNTFAFVSKLETWRLLGQSLKWRRFGQAERNQTPPPPMDMGWRRVTMKRKTLLHICFNLRLCVPCTSALGLYLCTLSADCKRGSGGSITVRIIYSTRNTLEV